MTSDKHSIHILILLMFEGKEIGADIHKVDMDEVRILQIRPDVLGKTTETDATMDPLKEGGVGDGRQLKIERKV